MRYVLLLSLFGVLIAPSALYAEELNAGFVQGLWYSSERVFAKTPVRMYVALRNNTESDLTGTVRFTIDGARIGTSQISALPGRLVEAWADWTPVYGEHTVKATLTDIKLHTIGGRAESATLSSTLAEDLLFVDYDTDEDGIGNREDLDDDNDGLSDDDEIDAGTDPLVFTKTGTSTDSAPDETSGTETEDSTEETETEKNVAGSDTTREGLEKYFDEGTVDNLLSSITEKVNTSKVSIDTYREERNEEKRRKQNETGSTGDTGSTLGEGDPSAQSLQQPGEEATITRTIIKDDNPGLIGLMVGGIASILGAFYTFVLFILSSALAHPGFMQLLLLLAILFGLYRLVKRIGSRPQ